MAEQAFDAPDELPIAAPDGTIGSMPKEHYDKALQSGYQVPVTAPDGTEGFVPGTHLDQAVKAGYRPADGVLDAIGESRYGGRGLQAGAAGAARMLTLGLSDAALTKTGLAKPETLEGLKEHNKAATMTGEGLGLVGSFAVPGLGEMSGIGAAAKAGSLAARGAEALGVGGAEKLLGRIATKTIGGAVEGGLYSAGQTVSDAALGDHQLNAEKLVAGFGLGALLGVAGGGLGGLVEEGASAVLPKLGKSIEEAQGGLQEFADNKTLKAAGAIQKDLKRISPEDQSAMAKMLRERGHVKPGSSIHDSVASIDADLEGQGQAIGEHIKGADIKSAPAYSEIHGALDKFEEGLNPLERKAISGKVKEVRDALTEMSSKPRSELNGFSALNDLKGTLQKSAKWTMGEDSVLGGLKRQLAGTFRDALDSQIVPALGADAGKAFVDAKDMYRLLSKAQEVASSAANRMHGNREFSLTDYLAGGAAGHLATGPIGMLTGAAGAMANKLVRERGDSVVAALAQRLADSPLLSTVAHGFAQKLPEIVPRLGEYGPILANAANQGVHEALATHMTMAHSDQGYRTAVELAGLQPEQPGDTQAMLQRAHGIAQVGVALRDHDKTLDSLVNSALHGKGGPRLASGVLGKQDFGSSRMRRESTDAYQKRADEVRHLAGSQQAVAERLAKNIGHVASAAPSIAAAASATALRAVQHLAQQLVPHPPPTPLGKPWAPSKAEVHRFSQVLEAVERPHSVLQHAAAGTLTPHAVEALKAAYPKLHAEMVKKTMDALASKPSVPRGQRLMLHMLTGIDPDGSLNPAAVQANQAVYRSPSRKDPENMLQPQKPPGRNQAGLSKLSGGHRAATSSQRADEEVT